MFTPLHAKSDYSLGYGTASVDELVARAAALGYRALALTDLENLYGQVRFHHRCREQGIRPLTGLELRPGFDGRRETGSRAGRVVLLAADGRGYRSLCRIVSARRGAAGRGGEGALGRDPLPLVARHPEGLFALSDDPAVTERLLACGSFPPSRLGVLLLRPERPAVDGARREAASRLGVRLVADLDVLFLEEGDHPLHLLQQAIRRGRSMGEVVAGGAVERRDRLLRSPAEARALFADLPEAVLAAAEIAEACRLDLGSERSTPFDLPGRSAARELRRLCEKALAESSPGSRLRTEAHRSRLEEELALFEKMGFSGLLLVVAEILAHCREEGIPAVARGSAVSSLALYLLGGSAVNPLAHGLLFERFLHPGKRSWPDVDLDLPWHRRDEVIGWVYDRYGRERVAMVAAHHTFRKRSALREGLKAWGEERGVEIFPALADRLGETHGLLLYEEDIMVLLSRTGGISLGEADELRAAIVQSGGDPAALAPLRAGFLARAGRGEPELDAARRAWAAAERFAAYSFNKAHAASYGRLAYLSAYAKAHHPLEFACALLNHHEGIYPLRTLAGEFARMGVELRGPHVNSSCWHSRLEDGGAVRVGLDKIRGFSRRSAADLLERRPFGTLRELLERVRLSGREMSALVLCGACDGLPPLAAADYPFPHEAALRLLREGGEPARLDALAYPRPAPGAGPARLYLGLMRVRNELRFLGMHLRDHPMALLRPEAGRYGCLPLAEAAAAPADSPLRLAAVVAAMRRVATRQGPMQFLTLEDETGLLEAAVLPPAYRRLGERVVTPGPFLAEGTLRRQQGAVHLEVERLSPFHERLRPFASPEGWKDP